MEIESGKTYLSKSYEEVGPMRLAHGCKDTWTSENQYGYWCADGQYMNSDVRLRAENDLYIDMVVGRRS